jgi:hypothetical protein
MNGKDLIEAQAAREDIVTEIHEKYPDTIWPAPILEPIFFGRLDKRPVLGRKLMLDKNTGNQFDIVSDQYELVYHEEVLHNLLNAIPPEFGTPNIHATMFKDGARASFSAKFPELKDYEIKGSETEVEYRLKNSYDRSTYLNYSSGLNELVCTNGLRSFVVKDKGRAKHIGQTINSFQLENRLKASLEDISNSHKIWLQWAETKISQINAISIVEELPYSEKEVQTLLALPLLNHGGESITSLKEKATLWTIMSAGTQMVHEIKSEERKLDLEEKIPSIISNQYQRIAA